MLIAEVKEQENIAEYILYMWQMEDLIRGNDFDLQKVLSKIFPNDKPSAERDEYARWFERIIFQMQEQQIEKTGHLRNVRTYMDSIERLHKTLLTVYQDKKYIALYKDCDLHLKALRKKNGSEDMPNTELCLVGLYGFLILKLSGKEVSGETKDSMKAIGQLIGYLAGAFNKLKNGELKLPSTLNN